MENLDFGSSDIGQLISAPEKKEEIIQEKKDDLQQMNMMEFSSSIDDLMPPPADSMNNMDQYTNPSNGRVTGISLETPAKKKEEKTNPFNLTDDQYDAVIAGIVGIIVYSTSIQTKLSGMVPNFAGINGSIASALLIAVVFFAVKKYILKK